MEAATCEDEEEDGEGRREKREGGGVGKNILIYMVGPTFQK